MCWLNRKHFWMTCIFKYTRIDHVCWGTGPFNLTVRKSTEDSAQLPRSNYKRTTSGACFVSEPLHCCWPHASSVYLFWVNSALMRGSKPLFLLCWTYSRASISSSSRPRNTPPRAEPSTTTGVPSTSEHGTQAPERHCLGVCYYPISLHLLMRFVFIYW